MQIFIPNMFKNVRNLTNSNGSNNNHNSTNRRLSIVDCFRSSSNKIHHVYRDSFHRAVYPIILVAQVFSLMPVEGISAANATFLRFKFYSIRTIYSCVFTVLAFLILAFEIYRVKNNNDATAKNLGTFYLLIFCLFSFMQCETQLLYFQRVLSFFRPQLRFTSCLSTLQNGGRNL